MKKLLTIAIATLGVSVAAHAGFVVEPSIGYQGATGTTPFQYTNAGVVAKYTQTSIPVGLQLKYQTMMGLFYGVRADYFASGALTTVNSQFANDTFTRTIVAAEIGYEGAKGIRVYGGYDVMNNITNTPGTTGGTVNTNDFTAMTNNGFNVGLGWRFHNHIAVNAEYDVSGTAPTAITPKSTGVSGSMTAGGYSALTDGGIVQINVSFPFGGSK